MKKKNRVKDVSVGKITPFLWFDDQVEEAAKFYISVFQKNSKVLNVVRYGKAGKKVSVDGLRTNMVCPGRLFRLSYPSG
jgi:predicted 3-demethylubiquinone-9 3-methyltransferase (glyoxalase superfamily)